MAELRVTKFNDDLMARLKSTAALSRVTLRDFLEKIVTDALRKKNGK